MSKYNYGYKLSIYLFKDSEQCNAVKAWREREREREMECVCLCVCERERDGD